MKAPQDCVDMGELRAAIDALDAELVALLAKRFAYIDRAADLKFAAGLPARIPERVEQVIQNIRAHAQDQGLDPDLLDGIWRVIIEASIAREAKAMGHKPA